MAKRTFLQHMQAFVEKSGIAESGPTTVVGQTGEMLRMINFWNDAHIEILNKYQDWNFMRSTHSANTAAGTRDYNPPNDWKTWDADTIKLGDEWLEPYEYNTVKSWYTLSTSNGVSGVVIIMPNGDLRLDPPPDAIYTLTADYWVIGTRLSTDAAESPIPEPYENVVMWKALMMFAADEHDQMLFQTASIRYEEMMRQLENAELPGKNFGALAKGSSNIVVIPQ